MSTLQTSAQVHIHAAVPPNCLTFCYIKYISIYHHNIRGYRETKQYMYNTKQKRSSCGHIWAQDPWAWDDGSQAHLDFFGIMQMCAVI